MSSLYTEIESGNQSSRSLNADDSMNKSAELIAPKQKTNQLKISEIHKWSPTTVKIIVFLLYYIVGVAYYRSVEGWSVLDCIYYITVTITTVGYGYFHPTSDKSKAFTIFYILFGIPIVLTIIVEFMKVTFTNFYELLIEFYFPIIYKRTKITNKELTIHKAILAWVNVVFDIFLGALFYSSNEGWTFFVGIYWSVCTITTVGYGDVTIQYDSTRLFDIVYSPYDEKEINPMMSLIAVADQFAGKTTVMQSKGGYTSSSFSKDRLYLEVLKKVDPRISETVSKIIAQIDHSVENDDFRHHFTAEDVEKHYEMFKMTMHNLENTNDAIVNPLHHSSANSTATSRRQSNA